MCYPDKFTEAEHRLCLLIILVNCALAVGAWQSFCVHAKKDMMRWYAMYEMAMGPC